MTPYENTSIPAGRISGPGNHEQPGQWSKVPGRLLPSWIDGFLEYTKEMPSPELFRKWAAIGTVAASLERKVWLISQREIVYPTLYVFLVADPGAGKTRPVVTAEKLMRSALSSTHVIAKSSLTKASLVDELADAARTIYTPGQDLHFHAMFISCHEFGLFMPEYDTKMLNALIYFYDCEPYTEKTRGGKQAVIVNDPCVNILACTNPNYLLTTMPIGAWEQGFLTRCIIIYSAEEMPAARLNLLDEEEEDFSSLREALLIDLKEIGAQCGRLRIAPDAAQAIEAWNERGQVDSAPNHPRLRRYIKRRPVHLLKLCLVACADRSGTLIELIDYQRALCWLIEAEAFMPDLFNAMQSGGDSAVIEDTYHFILTYPANHNGSKAPLHQVINYLKDRVVSSNLQRVLDVMQQSRLIEYNRSGNAVTVTALPLA